MPQTYTHIHTHTHTYTHKNMHTHQKNEHLKIHTILFSTKKLGINNSVNK